MRRLGFTVFKNALANIVRGGATAAVALILPHFLAHDLDQEHFAAWALMLQIAALASYLDFGLQTAIARYLAQALERGDHERRARLISTAAILLALAGLLAFIVIGLLTMALPNIFHQVKSSLVQELRIGLVVMSACAGLLLPLSAFTGVLVGLHRNEFPALAIGGSRILGALAVILAVHFTQSLGWLAVCVGVSNLIGGLAQYRIAKNLLPDMCLRRQYFSKDIARELAHYCIGLTVFSFAMLLISGLDVSIVGHFTFDAVGPYAVASTLITLVAGLSNSVFGAMMTPVAVLQARGELSRIRDLVIRSTQLSSYASLAITIPVFVYGLYALKVWVGPTYAPQALPILEVLLVAQAIRLIGNSYCTMLIATGQQKYGVTVALIEGFSNVIFSIAGAIWIGPIGVAWGTLIGALIGVVCMFPLTMQRAKDVPIPTQQFLREGILVPILAATPILLALVFMHTQSPSPNTFRILIFSAASSITLAGLLRKKPHAFRSRTA